MSVHAQNLKVGQEVEGRRGGSGAGEYWCSGWVKPCKGGSPPGRRTKPWSVPHKLFFPWKHTEWYTTSIFKCAIQEPIVWNTTAGHRIDQSVSRPSGQHNRPSGIVRKEISSCDSNTLDMSLKPTLCSPSSLPSTESNFYLAGAMLNEVSFIWLYCLFFNWPALLAVQTSWRMNSIHK